MAAEGDKKKRILKKAKGVMSEKKSRGKDKMQGHRDIGIDVIPPKESCNDRNCPFHGILSVRGQIIEGVVVSDRMQKTVVVKKDYKRYIPKYERYEWRTGKYMAHNPPCINARLGAKVRIMECRPLSKTKTFVVIEQRTK